MSYDVQTNKLRWLKRKIVHEHSGEDTYARYTETVLVLQQWFSILDADAGEWRDVPVENEEQSE